MKVTLKANETLEQLQAIIDEGGTHTPREAKRFAELGGGAQAGQSPDARERPVSYVSKRGTLVKFNPEEGDYSTTPQAAAEEAAPAMPGTQGATTQDVFNMYRKGVKSMTTEQAHQILERNGINPDAIKSIVMDVMKEYKVTPEQVAEATGTKVSNVIAARQAQDEAVKQGVPVTHVKVEETVEQEGREPVTDTMMPQTRRRNR